MLKIWHTVFYKRNNSSGRRYFDLERGVSMEVISQSSEKAPDTAESSRADEELKKRDEQIVKEKKENHELPSALKKDVETILMNFFRYEGKPKEFAAALRENSLCNVPDVLQRFPSVKNTIEERLKESGSSLDKLIALLKESEDGFDRQGFDKLIKETDDLLNNHEKIKSLDNLFSPETLALLEQGVKFSPFKALRCINTILDCKTEDEFQKQVQKKYLSIAASLLLAGDTLGYSIKEVRKDQYFEKKTEVEDLLKNINGIEERKRYKIQQDIDDRERDVVYPLVVKFIFSRDAELRQKTLNSLSAYCVNGEDKDRNWLRLCCNSLCVYKNESNNNFSNTIQNIERLNYLQHDLRYVLKIWKAEGDLDLEDFLDRFKQLIDKQGFEGKIQSENFDFDKCAPVWNHNFYGDEDSEKAKIKMKNYAADNIEVMLRLENKNPGICKKLAKVYGIRNYARYKDSMLEEQYVTQNEQGRYGIVLNPYDDHNGAFSHMASILERLSEQLKERGVKLRIVEAHGKAGIAKRLLKLDQLYGRNNKIECAVIGAHGAIDHMVFGKTPVTPGDFGLPNNNVPKFGLKEKIKRFLLSDQNEKTVDHNRGADGVFEQQDLNGPGVERIKSFFVDFPSIVLASCSTGKEGGVGQDISGRFKAEVLAPTQDASLNNIYVEQEEKGKLHLRIAFTDKNLKPIETIRYEKGKKKPLKK